MATAIVSPGLPAAVSAPGGFVGAKAAAPTTKMRYSRLPIIGHLPIGTQYVILGALLALVIAALALIIVVDRREGGNNTGYVVISGDALMHTQRVAKATPQAVQGNLAAFAQLTDSRDRLDKNLEVLANGGAIGTVDVGATSGVVRPVLDKTLEEWQKSQKNANLILKEQANLAKLGDAIRRINAANPAMLETAEQISALNLQNNVGPREISVAGQLVMLTQRMAKNANSLLAGDAIDPEVAFLLGKDTNTFRDLMQGLSKGSEALRLTASTDPETKEKLGELEKSFGEYQSAVSGILGNMQQLVSAKQAAQSIFNDNEKLLGQVRELSGAYEQNARTPLWYFLGLAIASILALLLLWAIVHVFQSSNAFERAQAERRAAEAEKQESEAKRLNDTNQAAILRLMNELAEVADGDLTVQATVSEDITGAIADSVNFTIEELRTVVARINVATAQVGAASDQATGTSKELLAATERQSNEIRQTGDSVLRMARDINEVSSGARQSADVARQSLAAAEKGMHAVQNSISGMNEIREQIQETSKRIKRLGESSQEIGEIVELISDITEQTNVLALNAAIQAASAGEAGRGFTVVAEEVQRLAERSAEATKQIGAIVKTIQTDTQDAVSAMEKSTMGVVEGAKLSDAAGQALGEIGQVSRKLAELIENISTTTSQQAQSAGGVARNIQEILSITEQTTAGTKQTAESVRQLAGLATELQQSVSGFKVA